MNELPLLRTPEPDWPGADDEPGFCEEHGYMYAAGGECAICEIREIP